MQTSAVLAQKNKMWLSTCALLLLHYRLSASVNECGLYLVPSRIAGAGRGIVAGKAYVIHEEIETVPTIQIPKRLSHGSQLTHYVFGSHDDRYDLVIFGPGSLYNHHSNRSVYYSWADVDVQDPTELPFPHTMFTHNTFRTTRPIIPGDEMLNFYGDGWFDRFASSSVGTQPLPPSIGIDELAAHGHCITDVFIDESTLSEAGLGVFADRDFEVGDAVVVTPVLALPRSLVDSTENSSLIKNYCIAMHDSNVVLFPLSYGALINHNTADKVNVQVAWYDWSPSVAALSAKYHHAGDEEPNAGHNLKLRDKLAMSVQELFNAPFAQLDIAYRATRPIKQGEELFLDYGSDWQAAWDEYISNPKDICVASSEFECELWQQVPVFRHYIAVPNDFYPKHWKTMKR